MNKQIACPEIVSPGAGAALKKWYWFKELAKG